MVGDFSSMLNLFLLFTDTFLLCRFFLARLIPQLLQKSPNKAVKCDNFLQKRRKLIELARVQAFSALCFPVPW